MENHGIDVNEDPFAFNKDFDPENSDHFSAWLEMRPAHISEGEWQFAIGELKLMLESEGIKTQRDRTNLILGWKSKNGLLPKER